MLGPGGGAVLITEVVGRRMSLGVRGRRSGRNVVRHVYCHEHATSLSVVVGDLSRSDLCVTVCPPTKPCNLIREKEKHFNLVYRCLLRRSHNPRHFCILHPSVNQHVVPIYWSLLTSPIAHRSSYCYRLGCGRAQRPDGYDSACRPRTGNESWGFHKHWIIKHNLSIYQCSVSHQLLHLCLSD